MFPAGSEVESVDSKARLVGWVLVAVGVVAIVVFVAVVLSGRIKLDAVEIAQQSTKVIVGMAVAFFAFVFLFGKLTLTEKKRTVALIILLIGSSMFWSGFEQAGSSLNLFADRFTQLEFSWFSVPSTWLQSAGPFFIIAFAPVFAWLWVALARRNLNPSTPVKFGFGLLFLALGFLVMVGAASVVVDGHKAMPTWLLSTYLLHTFGELALSPVGLSVTTKLAPKRFVGQMMGMWFLATALGNLIAGQMAGEFDTSNIQAMPDQYLQIALIAGGAGLIMLLLTKPIKYLMSGVD